MRRLFLYYLLITLISGDLYAGSYTWLGSTDSTWNNSANWTPTGIPGTSDTVNVNTTLRTLFLVANTTVKEFNLSAGAVVNCGGYNLSISNKSVLGTGAINNGRIIVTAGSSSITFQGAIINTKLQITSPQILLNGSVFNDSCVFIKTGALVNNNNGGNKFNSNVYLELTAASTFNFSNAVADTFFSNIQAYANGGFGSLIVFGNTQKSVFYGNLDLRSSGGSVYVGRPTPSTPRISLESGSSVTTHPSGFSGTLYFYNATSAANVPIDVTVGTAINMTFNDFYGSCKFNSTSLNFNNSKFRKTLHVIKTGSIANNWSQDIFYDSLKIENNSTTGIFRLASTKGNSFYGPVVCTAATAPIQLSYTDTSWYYGNITLNGPNTVFNAGTGISIISGNRMQLFSATDSFAISKLYVDKSDSVLTLDKAVIISNEFKHQAGRIVCNSNGSVVLKNGVSSPLLSYNRYIEGPVRKIGNTSFVFNVGRNGKARPVSIEAPVNATDTVSVEFYSDVSGLSSAMDSSIKLLDTCGYWKVYKSNTSDSIALTMFWSETTSCRVDDLNSLSMTRLVGSNWTNNGLVSSIGDTSAGQLTTNYITSGISSLRLGYVRCPIWASISKTSDSLAVQVRKGTLPLSYLWSDNATTFKILNDSSVNYFYCTVTDNRGCTLTTTFQNSRTYPDLFYATNPEVFHNYLNFKNLTSGQTLRTTDGNFNPVSCLFSKDYESIFYIKNIVMLEMLPKTRVRCTSPFTYSVPVEITYKDKNCITRQFERTFDITYDPDRADNYRYRSLIEFENGLDVTVRILQSKPNIICTSDSFVSFDITNDIFISRQLSFDCDLTTEIEVTEDTTRGEISLNLIDNLTPSEYDLEWTFYDYGTTQYSTSGAPSDFLNNATRVTLNEPFYVIDNLYPPGKLFFRARPVSYDGAGNRLVGLWSDIETVSTRGLDTIRNWNSLVTYYENGARTPVLSMSDGTLRERQKQTKSYESDDVIVGQTIYDFEGRPVLSTIPAPSHQARLNYLPNFNQNASGTAYTMIDFETGNCTTVPLAMKNTSGSSKYFSVNNTDKDSAEAYLPDAEGYPFTLKEFTPDKTGRIKRQSGVGAALKLGSGHETKYFYGRPATVELDRLFGNDAGYANTYLKEMVLDPNKQVSITYKDARGKVIATALAGPTPAAYTTIPDQMVPETLDVVLNDNQRREVASISSTFTYLVSNPGNYILNYNLNHKEFNLANTCTASKCFNCYYDVVFKINDNCGNAWNSGNEYRSSMKSANYPYADTSCHAVGNVDTLNTVYLEVGEYTIEKIISLNQTYLNQYSEFYVRNYSCKTFDDLLSEEINQLDFTGCNFTCTECMTSLGTRSAFVVNYQSKMTNLNPSDPTDYTEEANAAYDELLSVCDDVCSNNDQPCSYYYDMMLADVSPGGQYNKSHTDSTGTIFIDNHQFSVFDGGTYKSLDYKDGNGNDLAILIDSEEKLVKDLTPQEMIANWDDQWAHSLIKLHPEYCYYQFCLNTEASEQFKMNFLETATYQDAVDSNFICPLTGQSFGPCNSVITLRDEIYNLPRFNRFKPGTTMLWKDAIADALDNYFVSSDPGCSGAVLSAWDYACLVAKKGTITSPCNVFGTNNIYTDLTLCEAEKNVAWKMFQAIYMSLRNEMYSTGQQMYADSCNCCNGCIGMDLPDTLGISDKYNRTLCDKLPENCMRVKESTPRFITNTIASIPMDATVMQDSAEAGMLVACQTICNSYRASWQEALSECSFSVSLSDILDDMVEICISGCDGEHPNGSSSRNPLDMTSPTDFESLLSSVSLSPECNSDLIQFPQRYDVQSSPMANVIYDSVPPCVCEKIQTKYDEFLIDGPVEALRLLNEYYNMDFSESDIQFILAKCTNVSPLPCEFLEEPVQLSLELSCNVCLECTDLQSKISVVEARYGITKYHPDFLKRFTMYVNNHSGLNQTEDEYKSILDKCRLSAVLSCDDLQKSIDAFNNGPRDITFIFYLGKNLGFVLTDDDLNSLLSDCKIDPATILPCMVANNNPETSILPFLLEYMPLDSLNDTTLLNYMVKIWDSNVLESIEILHSLCTELTDVQSQYRGPGPTPFPEINWAYFIQSYNSTVFNSWSVRAILGLMHYCGGNPPEQCELIRKLNHEYYAVHLNSDTSFADFCNVRLNTKAKPEDYQFMLDACGINNNRICSRPYIYNVEPDTASCVNQLMQLAYTNAWDKFIVYTDSVKSQFDSIYAANCLGVTETFKMAVPFQEYHYTLYYYDYAGNLVKTVPPLGVNPKPAASLDSIANHRNKPALYPTALYPFHTLSTNYYYNSLNKVTRQVTPDGGATDFYYDQLGRVVVSQNAAQAAGGRYSFSLYDALGRIWQSGVVVPGYAVTTAICRNTSNFDLWLKSGAHTEVITTYYDKPIINLVLPRFTQDNLRNRVATVTYELTDDGNDLTYNSASHYSYDLIGNVKTVIQENNQLASINKNLKRIDYVFELISGKVNYVWYQRDSLDQLAHRYFYDADNRLREVETSENGYTWYKESDYKYYKHGALARVGLGHFDVQGVDYAYTLSGWMKLINSTMMDTILDLGKDGKVGSGVAKDVYSYSLGYYNGDYKAIGATAAQVQNNEALDNISPELYNGNIRHTTSVIEGIDDNQMLGKRYNYDQLNRLIAAQTFNGLLFNPLENKVVAMSSVTDYTEGIKYDANGNITKLTRQGANISALAMDSLTYNYYNSTNRLKQVIDSVPGGNYSEDIDNQSSATNYTYDQVGNLKTDNSQLQTYSWYDNGKLQSVTKLEAVGGDPAWRLEFYYDPMGNRVEKRYITYATGYPNKVKSTYYVRDAQGNTLSTYTWDNNDVLKQDELDLYGSSRLGLYKPDRTLYDKINGVATPQPLPLNHYLGRKQYELTNHLGNVMATISDQAIAVDVDADGKADRYEAAVISGQDYYAGGAPMPGRSYSASGSSNYRYGFNGKENDNEVKGNGNLQDYGMRIYDPRLGKFLSVDPLSNSYPMLTPYQFASNSPIASVDLDGLEAKCVVNENGKLTAPAIQILKDVVPGGAELLKKLTFSVNDSYVPEGMGAITIGFNVYLTTANSKLLESNTYETLKIVAHEGTHGNDVDEMGAASFYLNYIIEGAKEMIKKGTFDPQSVHDDIPAEKKAIEVEKKTGVLLKNNPAIIKTVESEKDDATKIKEIKNIKQPIIDSPVNTPDNSPINNSVPKQT